MTVDVLIVKQRALVNLGWNYFYTGDGYIYAGEWVKILKCGCHPRNAGKLEGLWSEINFLKNCQNLKFHLTHCLTDHSHKPRAQTKQRITTILHHNNKFTSGMCLLGFRRVRGLCASLFLLSSIRLFFMQRNHIDVLLFPINTFLEQCI